MKQINENLIICSSASLLCRFEENNFTPNNIVSSCRLCCFIHGSKSCNMAPCIPDKRTDGKNGYFTFKLELAL